MLAATISALSFLAFPSDALPDSEQILRVVLVLDAEQAVVIVTEEGHLPFLLLHVRLVEVAACAMLSENVDCLARVGSELIGDCVRQSYGPACWSNTRALACTTYL